MLSILPILVLLTASLAMLVIYIVRPNFSYFWLIAALGVLLAWPMVLLSGLHLPQTVTLMTWQPQSLFLESPSLLVDNYSWPYALALATLALAVILTAVSRMQPLDWGSWAASLTLTALGVLSVLAGNTLTLLLAWAALDLAGLIILLLEIPKSADRERVVFAFTVRVAGIISLILAGLVARSSGTSLNFTSIPTQANFYLLLAAGLHLGVFPIHQPFLQEVSLRRGLGTTLRLVPAAASLVLIARVATLGISASFSLVLLILTGLSALFGAWAWLTASDELSGRPFWIIGMASLAIAAAIRAQPAASIAWGVACLYSGGLLFLGSIRPRNLLPLFTLGLLGFTGLPFTPAWSGMELYAAPFSPLLIIFLLTQAILIVGYIWHMLKPGEQPTGYERWILVIYPSGLGVLLIAYILFGWLVRLGFENMSGTAWWLGAIPLALAVFYWWLSRRTPRLSQVSKANQTKLFSFGWLDHMLWLLYRSVGRTISTLTLVFEGEGGILWALVLLALLLSFLAQIRWGG